MFKICDYGDYYLIVNTKGSKKNHTHFNLRDKNKQSVLNTCNMLIRLMKKQVIPESDFLLDSAIRLSNDKEYLNKLLIEKERRLGSL